MEQVHLCPQNQNINRLVPFVKLDNWKSRLTITIYNLIILRKSINKELIISTLKFGLQHKLDNHEKLLFMHKIIYHCSEREKMFIHVHVR